MSDILIHHTECHFKIQQSGSLRMCICIMFTISIVNSNSDFLDPYDTPKGDRSMSYGRIDSIS